jgi:ammonium transporter, Amt family
VFGQTRSDLKPLNKRFHCGWQVCLLLSAAFWLMGVETSAAQSLDLTELEAAKQDWQVGLNTIWVIFTACLVFFMNAGFAMLEAGFCRQKNTVNILAKTLIVFALSTVAFWALGFGIMFGDGNPFFGTIGFLLEGLDNSPNTNAAYEGVYSSLSGYAVPLEAKFFFHLTLAGVTTTIVSGAVAERIKFLAFFIFSLFMAGVAYPIVGHWVWGNGWLAGLGFWDFAGSTVVHSVGGWASLVGAVLLGPRIGKYHNGNSLALPGHNFSTATLGCIILWLGWFGFNPGSTLAADSNVISHVLLTTNMAAATGGIAATLTSWWYFGKPDLSMTINGILSGLVAISASCRYVTIGWAGVIGLIAGAIVVFAVDFFDKLQIDDPVGAVSVHLIGGVWGTLSVALFALGPDVPLNDNFILYEAGPAKGLLVGGGLAGWRQLFVQLLGIASISLLTLLLSWLAWSSIKYAVGLRVSFDAELKGLDISEHGLHAYNDFLVKQDSSQNLPRGWMSRRSPPSRYS